MGNALLNIARFIGSIAIGYVMAYTWMDIRRETDWIILGAVGGGSALICYLLLHFSAKGGGS